MLIKDVDAEQCTGFTSKYMTLNMHLGKVQSYLGMTWDFTVEGYVEEILMPYDLKGTSHF